MQNEFPLVGIVLLNWNGYDHTKACLESLQALDYPRYRVYVVDNHSSDGSGDKLAQSFTAIQYIQNEANLGFAGGVNRGIEAAVKICDYIWLLNNDAKIENCCALTELVAACRANPQIGAAGSIIVGTDGHIQFSGARISYPRLIGKHEVQPVDSVRETDYVTGCSMLVPASVYRECGLIDEKYFLYYEDADFCYKLKQKGYICVVVPTSRIVHELGGTSKKNPRLNYTYYNLRNRLLFASSWLKGFSFLWVLLVITAETFLRLIRYLGLGRRQSAKMLWAAFRSGITKQTGPYTLRT